LALLNLIREGGFGLPELIVQQLLGDDFGQSAVTIDNSKLETLLGEHGELLRRLVGNTKPGYQFQTMPNGDVVEITPDNKRIIHKK
jgi:hypothetical protein